MFANSNNKARNINDILSHARCSFASYESGQGIRLIV